MFEFLELMFFLGAVIAFVNVRAAFYRKREYSRFRLGQEVASAARGQKRARDKVAASWRLHELRQARDEARWERLLQDLGGNIPRETVKH